MYKVKGDVIPRDIAGIYFLVDISEKDYYSKKEIFSTNQTGYEQFKIMQDLNVFTIDDLVSRFIMCLTDYTDELYAPILSDTTAFIRDLITAGYVEELSQ